MTREDDLTVFWGVILAAEALKATKSSFAIGQVTGQPVIACLLCRRLSYHRKDITERYCGHCHVFHDAVSLARLAHADGATHECHEWRTGVSTCAICGAELPPEDIDDD